jgi:hypothetical protein
MPSPEDEAAHYLNLPLEPKQPQMVESKIYPKLFYAKR